MPPTLQTQRLLLRPYRSDDVDDILGYATDAEWARSIPVPHPYTRRDAEEFVAAAIRADDETRFQWAIEHGGRVSGGITLWIVRSGSAEIGYNIARPLWGGGLATEAAAAVVAFGFRELGLARVQASTDIRNTASWRVMEKLGMAREGVARENRLLKGERVDDVLYAVLRGEWHARERSRGS